MATPPISCISTLQYYDPNLLVALPHHWSFLFAPDLRPHTRVTRWSQGRGSSVGAHGLRKEAISRGARILRTALGPAIARWLEGPGVAEVMLNPDGRLWRPSGPRFGRHRRTFVGGRWRTHRPPRCPSCRGRSALRGAA